MALNWAYGQKDTNLTGKVIVENLPKNDSDNNPDIQASKKCRLKSSWAPQE